MIRTKETSLYLLLFLALLFLIPKTNATYLNEEIQIDITVYEQSGIHNHLINTDFLGETGTYLDIDLSNLLLEFQKDSVVFINDGDFVIPEANNFLVSGSTKIYAFLKLYDEKVTLFIDSNSELLDVQYGQDPIYSGPTPSKPNYSFTEFYVKSVSEDDVVLMVANYQRNDHSSIDITVEGGTSNKSTYAFNDVVKLSPNQDLSSFAYWSDSNGVVISSNPNYSFSALMPMTIIAHYIDNYQESFSVYLHDVSGIRKDMSSYLGYINNPNQNNFRLIEYGLLVSEFNQTPVYGGNDVIVIPSTTLAPTNEFLRSLDFSAYNTIRAYAIYEENGINKITYSDNIFSKNDDPTTNFEESLKILAIGNSYTIDSMEYLYQIADTYGVEHITLGNLFIPGESLEGHATHAISNDKSYFYAKNDTGVWEDSSINYSILDALLEEAWDIIVIQQSPWDSGLGHTYEPYLSTLVDYIDTHKNNTNAEIFFHLIWAYESNTTLPDFSNFNYNQSEMYQAIISNYLDIVAENPKIKGVIPTGTAIQNIRSSFIGDNLTRDGFHLSYDLGRLSAAYTWFSAITGLSIENIAYKPQNVLDGELEVIKDSVNSAVDFPFEVTQSNYPQTHTLLNNYLNYVSGKWDGTVNYDAFITDNNYVTHKFKLNKGSLPVGSILELESGYKYRLDYFGIWGAKLTTDWITAESIVIDAQWWHVYDYVAITISSIDENVDFSSSLIDTANKLKIKSAGNISYVSGFWWGSESRIHQNDFHFLHIASTIQERIHYDVGTTIIVDPNYILSIVFFIQVEDTLAAYTIIKDITGEITLTHEMWQNYKYIAFYVENNKTEFLDRIISGNVGQMNEILTFN